MPSTAATVRVPQITSLETAIRLYYERIELSKPDTDNLQKLLKDCMTAVGFWKDDALVASELCEKFWAQIPGIFIKIEVLE